MSIKTRYQRWTNDHDLSNEDVARFAIFGGTFVACAAAITAIIHHDVKESKKIDEWTRHEYENGRHVYQLMNGALISTDEVRVY